MGFQPLADQEESQTATPEPRQHGQVENLGFVFGYTPRGQEAANFGVRDDDPAGVGKVLDRAPVCGCGRRFLDAVDRLEVGRRGFADDCRNESGQNAYLPYTPILVRPGRVELGFAASTKPGETGLPNAKDPFILTFLTRLAMQWHDEFDPLAPQREAAFFYGLFLRGHSVEELRQDIDVPRKLVEKWLRAPDFNATFRESLQRVYSYRKQVLAIFDGLVLNEQNKLRVQ
jgi:hypothetical protein